MSPLTVLLINLLAFLARHMLFAGAAFVTSRLGQRLGRLRRIQSEPAALRQVLREMAWSASSGVVFVAAMAVLLATAENGYTRIYTDVSEYGTAWLFASIPCILILHDAYFYWTHRWMHELRILRPAHRLHHTFHNPTSWSAFSFHPGEALIEAGILPLVAWTLPVHPLALFAFTTLMTAQSVAIHCGFERTPGRRWLTSSWWMGSRAHNDHHRGQRGNYGLYLTFWDVAMGTDVPASTAAAGSGAPISTPQLRSA